MTPALPRATSIVPSSRSVQSVAISTVPGPVITRSVGTPYRVGKSAISSLESTEMKAWILGYLGMPVGQLQAWVAQIKSAPLRPPSGPETPSAENRTSRFGRAGLDDVQPVSSADSKPSSMIHEEV